MINFDLPEYSFVEGEPGAQDIRVQFRRTQNPFTLILYPVSHTEAMESYNIENFVGAPPEEEVDRATSGKIYIIFIQHVPCKMQFSDLYLKCTGK